MRATKKIISGVLPFYEISQILFLVFLLITAQKEWRKENFSPKFIICSVETNFLIWVDGKMVAFDDHVLSFKNLCEPVIRKTGISKPVIHNF